VPKGPPPKPLAESELNIADLAFGEVVEADLDCPEGRCRVRYRLVVPRAGKLHIEVDGPDQPEPGVGPRLARVVVEGPGQDTLAILYPDPKSHDGLLSGDADATGGVHYILIQGVGGRFDYRLSTRFEEGAALAGPATPLALPDETLPDAKPDSFWKSRAPSSIGDIGDGADFAYDPNRDLKALRTYAFAQDPAAMLKEQGETYDINPFVQRQAQREVRYALIDMGFSQAPANEADFLVSVHGGSTSTTWYSFNAQVVMRPYGAYFQDWRGAGMNIRAHSYQDGTLIIDFIDARTGELIWHGWTTEPLPSSVNEDEVLKQAVQTVLAQF
jgi:hypothetical protein